jgi:hypothetical protein
LTCGTEINLFSLCIFLPFIVRDKSRKLIRKVILNLFKRDTKFLRLIQINFTAPGINTIEESALSFMINSKNISIIYNVNQKQFSFYLTFVPKHCSPVVCLKG